MKGQDGLVSTPVTQATPKPYMGVSSSPEKPESDALPCEGTSDAQVKAFGPWVNQVPWQGLYPHHQQTCGFPGPQPS